MLKNKKLFVWSFRRRENLNQKNCSFWLTNIDEIFLEIISASFRHANVVSRSILIALRKYSGQFVVSSGMPNVWLFFFFFCICVEN